MFKFENGDIVIIRSGKMYIVINGRLLGESGFLLLKDYNEELKTHQKSYDITKVYRGDLLYWPDKNKIPNSYIKVYERNIINLDKDSYYIFNNKEYSYEELTHHLT